MDRSSHQDRQIGPSGWANRAIKTDKSGHEDGQIGPSRQSNLAMRTDKLGHQENKSDHLDEQIGTYNPTSNLYNCHLRSLGFFSRDLLDMYLVIMFNISTKTYNPHELWRYNCLFSRDRYGTFTITRNALLCSDMYFVTMSNISTKT